LSQKKILIIRLSAFGDVILSLPVIKAWALQNPSQQFAVLTKPRFRALFENLAPNVSTLNIDFGTQYKGFWGIIKLFFHLNNDISSVVDLHNVLRSNILTFLFSLVGKKVSKVKKHRKTRKLLVAKTHKLLAPMPTAWERYNEVFKSHQLTSPTQNFDNFSYAPLSESEKVKSFFQFLKPHHQLVVIAPFAAHDNKMYPANKMEQVLKILSTQSNLTVLLIGNGKKENEQINNWLTNLLLPANIQNISNQFSLQEEMEILAKANLVLAMDSANLHLASWVGTKVLSIWGPTHPYAGFDVWQSNEVISVDLPCRPCSIYGNKPCFRGDLACMNQISPEFVVKKIVESLNG